MEPTDSLQHQNWILDQIQRILVDHQSDDIIVLACYSDILMQLDRIVGIEEEAIQMPTPSFRLQLY